MTKRRLRAIKDGAIPGYEPFALRRCRGMHEQLMGQSRSMLKRTCLEMES